jgi:tetratricopeptide (TPR) repeat protein
MKFFTTLTIFILSALFFVEAADAQANEYQRANVLMQQQKFEEALPILETLYDENPRSYVFFDLYTDCLVNLKRFDEAEAIAREQVDQQRFRIQAAMKLAEILHLRGDKDDAMEVWMDEAEREAGNIQSYYTIGSSMASRQEYDAAINLYRSAQQRFSNETLFLNELANTYLQAGRFEESVNEYFRLIIHSPDQMSLVQQRFLRMRDQNLFEIAAFELEDQLLELNHNHEAYSSLYQLLTWLLLETEEFQRAFVLARQYENRTGYTILFAILHLQTNFYQPGSLSLQFKHMNTTSMKQMNQCAPRHVKSLRWLTHNGYSI